ncbi:hypothetical protein V4D09_18865 [Vibrio mimicus]|uniref:hypothetical protein n=1 Tax=Vibrio mimicus TaxID=674 RepID=UPI002F9511CF
MGWFSSVWEAVKSVGSAVTKVVKKVYEVCTSNSAVDAYDRLERVIDKYHQEKSAPRPSDNAPDFFGSISSTEVENKLNEQSRQLIQHDSEIKQSKQVMALQVELSRLRGSADIIDRSMKNVKIHASSLSVHYQNMRNINGLIDDVNGLRHGLKAAISTINYNANLMSSDGSKPRKIEGVDVEKQVGSISQVAAYDAFDRTRELLRNEVIELSELSSKHLNDIKKLKINASTLGGELGAQIIDFVDHQIVPIVKQAESAGLLLKSEVANLPAAVREPNGSLIFEDGSIKLEKVSS